MADEKKIIRLVDVGELEARLREILETLEEKLLEPDLDELAPHSESISCELEDLGNLPTIDPASCLNWYTGKPPEHESMFAKFKGTEQWRLGMFETMSDEALVTIEFPDKSRYVTTSHTVDGRWLDSYESIGGHIVAWAEMPAPAQEEKNNG